MQLFVVKVTIALLLLLLLLLFHTSKVILEKLISTNDFDAASENGPAPRNRITAEGDFVVPGFKFRMTFLFFACF